MEPLQWKSSFELGVKEIDDEHRDLFERARRLHAAAGQEDLARCSAISNEILAAAAQHFENEEAFLTRTGYPDTDDHKVLHERLTAEVLKLRKLCGADTKMADVWACYSAVVAFLIDDVVGGDSKFKSWLIEHGYT